MNLPRLALLLLVWLTTASLALAQEWKTYVAGQDGFSVKVPGQPKRIANTIPSAFGPVKLIFHGFSVDKLAFFASFYDLPPTWTGDVDKALDGERNRGLGNTGCELVSEKPVDVAGVKGRDVVADQTTGTQRVRARNFVIGRRLYSLILIGPRDETADAVAKEFFDSFALTPTP